MAIVVIEDRIAYLAVRWKNNLHLFVLILNNTIKLASVELTKLSNDDYSADDVYMSMSFHEQSQLIIIGIPSFDKILIVSVHTRENPKIVKEHHSIHSGVLFGQSVAMLNDGFYAVLAHSLPTLPWSLSQVQVYSIDDSSEHIYPLFVFPNNQQILPSRPLRPYHIVRLVAWESNIGLILNGDVALIIEASPPGYYSAQIQDLDNIHRTAPISLNEEPSFSGLWLPSVTTGSLWDSHLYTDGDEYLRYQNMEMSLIIDISESEFYMKNTQEPIAREYEIVFKAILFS
ncbi:unnamed protein product, partial [Rotaria sp. Silwood1]